MFLRLLLGNYFFTREGYLVGVLLGAMGGLIIGTVEGSLVGLSLVLPLGHLNEYQNPGVFCLSHCWAHLFGCALDMKRSGISFTVSSSKTAAKLLTGGSYFLRPLL